MKTRIAIVTALLFFGIVGSFAQDTKLSPVEPERQCTSYEVWAKDAAEHEASVVKLTDIQKATLVKKHGNPPGLDETGPWEAFLITAKNGQLAAISIFQGGCFLVNFGPGYTVKILQAINPEDETL